MMILHFEKCKAGLKLGGRSPGSGRTLELSPITIKLIIVQIEIILLIK